MAMRVCEQDFRVKRDQWKEVPDEVWHWDKTINLIFKQRVDVLPADHWIPDSMVAYVKLRTFVLWSREVRVFVNGPRLSSLDHFKSLLSLVLVFGFEVSQCPGNDSPSDSTSS
jgi:hypothetical protein